MLYVAVVVDVAVVVGGYVVDEHAVEPAASVVVAAHVAAVAVVYDAVVVDLAVVVQGHVVNEHAVEPASSVAVPVAAAAVVYVAVVVVVVMWRLGRINPWRSCVRQARRSLPVRWRAPPYLSCDPRRLLDEHLRFVSSWSASARHRQFLRSHTVCSRL